MEQQKQIHVNQAILTLRACVLNKINNKSNNNILMIITYTLALISSCLLENFAQ